MPDDLATEYARRIPLLEDLSRRLQSQVEDALENTPHIDRVSFRVKSATSFLNKALDPENVPAYEAPLTEIEDQIAGRVIVFFLADIQRVLNRIAGVFTSVESSHRQPQRDQEFGYESHHLIRIIPPMERPPGWTGLIDPPNTFELQVRTIFMHAYSEPQHNFGYKGSKDLPPEIRKELAWIAASAWGADRAYSRVADWEKHRVDD
jgi:putative GTP pyrophosphokinase